MKIVFLSHTSRNSVYKVGSYHLSNEAIKISEVLYINPPLTPLHYLKALINREYRQTVFKAKIKHPRIIKEKNGIINYTPFKILSFRKFFGLERTLFAEKSEISWVHKRTLRRLGFDKVDIVIQDNLNLTFFRNIIKSNSWIYRPTDDILSMPNQSKKYLKIEDLVVRFSDKIIVTSTKLKEIIKLRYGIKSNILHNGINLEELKAMSTDIPKELTSIYENKDKIIVVYIGSLDERFDFELIKYCARKLPDHLFIIGGSNTSHFGEISNVIEIGEVAYEQVAIYYNNADYGILPFDIHHPGNKTRSPMKLYEMAAFNLNVISTPFDEIILRKNNFLKIANTKSEFVQFLQNKPISFLIDCKEFPTWENNLKKIIDD